MNDNPLRICIVDDDAAFTRVLARALERRGYPTLALCDAAQVVDQVGEWKPDVLLLDLRMGNASGFDLIRPCRELDAELMIILVTGYASIATAVHALKLGADDYLAKPLDVDMVIQTIHGGEAPEVPDTPMSPKRVEWEHIQRVLEQHDGNISATARALGMHRRTLQRKLQKRPVQS